MGQGRWSVRRPPIRPSIHHPQTPRTVDARRVAVLHLGEHVLRAVAELVEERLHLFHVVCCFVFFVCLLVFGRVCWCRNID